MRMKPAPSEVVVEHFAAVVSAVIHVLVEMALPLLRTGADLQRRGDLVTSEEVYHPPGQTNKHAQKVAERKQSGSADSASPAPSPLKATFSKDMHTKTYMLDWMWGT